MFVPGTSVIVFVPGTSIINIITYLICKTIELETLSNQPTVTQITGGKACFPALQVVKLTSFLCKSRAHAACTVNSLEISAIKSSFLDELGKWEVEKKDYIFLLNFWLHSRAVPIRNEIYRFGTQSGFQRQICPRTFSGGGEGPEKVGCPEKFTMTIPRLFLRLFFFFPIVNLCSDRALLFHFIISHMKSFPFQVQE